MDPMAQAFAYYDFDDDAGTLVYTAPTVQGKYFHNNDDVPGRLRDAGRRWENRWRHGQNACSAGLPPCRARATARSRSARSSPRSDAFAQCQVQKVFKAVCFRAPGDAAGSRQGRLDDGELQANGYQLKQVFAETATYCMGD